MLQISNAICNVIKTVERGNVIRAEILKMTLLCYVKLIHEVRDALDCICVGRLEFRLLEVRGIKIDYDVFRGL